MRKPSASQSSRTALAVSVSGSPSRKTSPPSVGSWEPRAPLSTPAGGAGTGLDRRPGPPTDLTDSELVALIRQVMEGSPCSGEG